MYLTKRMFEFAMKTKNPICTLGTLGMLLQERMGLGALYISNIIFHIVVQSRSGSYLRSSLVTCQKSSV